jgi:hypothetical protein
MERGSSLLSPLLTRGLSESDIHLSSGLATARGLRALTLLSLLWVTDHPGLRTCGALDGL